MSDRTPSSVRTGDRSSDPAQNSAGTGDAQPAVSATQSIPASGSLRAQKGNAPSAPKSPAAPPVPPVPVAPPGSGGAGAASAGRPAAAPPGAAAGRPGVPGSAGQPGRTGRPSRPKGGPKGGGKAGRGPRRARLQLRHVDIWSAFKISLVLSVALFFIWMVAIGILYGVLNGLGVFRTVNDLFGQLGSAAGGKHTGDIVTPGIVLGGAAVVGAVNIILMTALGTVGTFIYNMCADLVGGLEVTLSERD